MSEYSQKTDFQSLSGQSILLNTREAAQPFWTNKNPSKHFEIVPRISESDADTSTALELLRKGGYCPRFNAIRLLSVKAVEILDNEDVLQNALDYYEEDALLLTVNEKSYKIPSVLTSRGTLDFLGFTESRVKELWNLLKEPELEPGVSLSPPIDEFGKRMIKYMDNIIKTISLWTDEGQLKSSANILGTLGLKIDVQLQDLLQSIPPSGPGLGRSIHTFQLRKICPHGVLAMAKRYIERGWMLLKEMNLLIVSQEEGWWEKIFNEFTQSPIDPTQAYTTVIDDFGFISLHENHRWAAA